MTITFDRINQIAADHARREAARHTPKAIAIRSVYQLSSTLADLDAIDCAAVLELLRSEVPAAAVCDFATA